MSGCWLYILECRDHSLYVGTTRYDDPALREAEHNAGIDKKAYTYRHRPVRMVFTEFFPTIADAIEAEQQVKGWGRAKKLALIRRDWDTIQQLARRQTPFPSKSAPHSPPC